MKKAAAPNPRRENKKRGPNSHDSRRVKSFFDCVAPGVIRFFPDSYILGDTYRCVWAIREYPTSTQEQAILARLGDQDGVTLHIFNRQVEPMEQRRIVNAASRKNRLMAGDSDVSEAVQAEGNLQDLEKLLAQLRVNNDALLHCAVFLELKAKSAEDLKNLQTDISMELTRAKLTADRLFLRQREGFLSAAPFGANQFGPQYERVLPSPSVANLYPLNFSGKTDPRGFYIGKDKYGSNVLVDLDSRTGDKTNGSVLILGNSGQGKSYLLKLLLTNLRESGKSILCLDPEAEYRELTEALGGSYIDYMSGEYLINVLEPKAWTEDAESDGTEPNAFRKTTRLSQHIAFLKDFFRCYKDFSDPQLDTIEVLLEKLYERFGITDSTDFSALGAKDYPILSDFFTFCSQVYEATASTGKNLYTQELLREVCLGIRSMCVGSESKYFNGHTNLRDDKFLCFGVKGILDTNQRLRSAMLFNILSYLSNQLLTVGNTVASVDELYLFLTNRTAIEYLRNAMKRARKKESSVILASQNIEDFLIPEIREFTKPLFSIPTHQFLFYPGSCSQKEYQDALQVDEAEFKLIQSPEQGTCLYRCGVERYLLQVHAPAYKEAIFGTGGGR